MRIEKIGTKPEKVVQRNICVRISTTGLHRLTSETGLPPFKCGEAQYCMKTRIIKNEQKKHGGSGLRQARPKAIISFDGTNYNFFSSKNTYALYQDEDTYKLDVTSYLLVDTPRTPVTTYLPSGIIF